MLITFYFNSSISKLCNRVEQPFFNKLRLAYDSFSFVTFKYFTKLIYTIIMIQQIKQNSAAWYRRLSKSTRVIWEMPLGLIHIEGKTPTYIS